MTKSLFPKERRHTLHFLSCTHNVPLFYLNTEIEIPFQEIDNSKIPWTAVVARAVAGVIKQHPGANAAFIDGFTKRIATYQDIALKFTVDRNIGGVRVVLAAVLPEAEKMSVEDIKNFLYRVKNDPISEVPEFAGAMQLQKVPLLIGAMAFRLASKSIERRQKMFGTVAITTLGHAPIKSFFGYGGTALTFGIGRAYKVDHQLQLGGPGYILPLSLTVDHRVIDGAEAAEIMKDMHEAVASILASLGFCYAG